MDSATDQRPFLSVIVPVFNDDERLGLCLACLARQTYPRDRFEIIVIDNGSTNPPSVPEGVRVVREEKPGSYAARNAGLAIATGEWLFFTDADCLPAEDWLEQGLRAIHEHPEAGIIAGRIDVAFRDSARPRLLELYDGQTYFRQQWYVETIGFGMTANLAVSRATFDRVGTFDGRLKSSGDYQWCKSATAAGERIAYADAMLVRHPGVRSVRALLRRARRIAGGFKDNDHEIVPTTWRRRLKMIAYPLTHHTTIVSDPRLKTPLRRAFMIALGIAERTTWLREIARVRRGAPSMR